MAGACSPTAKARAAEPRLRSNSHGWSHRPPPAPNRGPGTHCSGDAPDAMSRILIVEDEQHIANGLRFNLEAEGHEATVVGDAEGALQLLLRDGQPFDAVILDVMLPGKDGFTAAAELRAAGQYVPIL